MRITVYTSFTHSGSGELASKPLQMRLSLKSRGTFRPPPLLFQQHCHAHRQLRRCARQGHCGQSAEDSTKPSAPPRRNHHILAEGTLPSPPIGDAGRTWAVFNPDDTTTMSSSGSNPNPRSSTRAETSPPLVRRAGPGRRGRDGREGDVCLALESGLIQAVGGAQRRRTSPLTKFELTIADP